MGNSQPFNPRQAALNHAGLAKHTTGTIQKGDYGHDLTVDLEDLANSVACGLVYVGDQIRRLADARELEGAARDDLADEVTAIAEQALGAFVTVVLNIPADELEGIDATIARGLPDGYFVAATYPGDLVTDEERQG
jgi:hypothetical protein